MHINYCCLYVIYTCVYSIVLSVLAITNFLLSSSLPWYHTNLNYTHVQFDYIVVGAGTGGSVLIQELPRNKSILLLEAGSWPHSLLDIPMLSPLLQRSPYDWQYETEPQTHACWGLENQRSKWPRGKVLGGSSRLNYMVYLRGHENDFLTWPSNWKFSDFYQYASRVTYSTLKPLTLLSSILLSKEEPGLDLNHGNCTGFMSTPATITEGLRSCCDQYIDLNNDRLTVLVNAFVTKILFEGNTAVGVEYEVNGVNYSAHGNTVILSAGSISSPHLLLLSGVGPSEHLSEHNIPVIAHSPGVGQNLQDHIGTGVDNVLINTTLISPYVVVDFSPFWEFMTKKQGLWANSGVELVALLKTDASLSVPDIQLMIIPSGISVDVGTRFRYSFGISQEIWDSYFQLPERGQAISFLIVLLHPHSKGFVRLRDSNPHSKPIIDPRYLTDKRDVDTLVKGIRLVQTLISTNPGLRSVNASLRSTLLPGCAQHSPDSNSYWECFVRSLSLTSYHPVGTCAMHSVVDSNLKVHGVHNIYIGDASVMPTIPSANTQALTILIAQKLGRHLQYIEYASHVTCPRHFMWTKMCCLLT